MSSSRAFGVGETSLASAIRESVDFPIAETVPTTFSPRRFASTKRLATCRTFSASATEEPPNFITTVSTVGCPISPLRHQAGPAIRLQPRRHGYPGTERRVRDGVERLDDERQVAGPDVEVGVGRVAVVGTAVADLRGGLVERQRQDRGRLELFRGRLPRFCPTAGK